MLQIKPFSFAAAFLVFASPVLALNISGSTTVAGAILLPNEEEIEVASGVQLDVVANGSSRGIDDLVNGRADLAMISAPLDVTIQKIEKKSPGSLSGADLRDHQIGETRVAFVVHPSNTVTSLTLDQVAAVLSGDITNWSDLGGADMAIVIVAETLGGGVRTLVESKLTDGASVAGTVREFPNATQVPVVVSQMPQAFGIAPHGAATAAGSTIIETSDAIVQPLILVSLGDPTDEQVAVIKASKATQ